MVSCAHPSLDSPPSLVDRLSLWRIAHRRNYATDNPVLLIVENEPPARVFRVYGFGANPLRRDEVSCLTHSP